ncbi:MAG: N-acetylmuramoyl-L-alanine amidase [Acidobacteriota bacterium]
MSDGSEKRRRSGPGALRSTPRRQVLKEVSSLLLFAFGLSLGNLDARAARLHVSNRYSPKNKRRPKRPHTRYIILHTTEGGEGGSLKKILSRGEAHYFVTRRGRVYRTIDKSRIATHAGRSMWNGQRVIDNYSIGIEVVGYHNKDLTPAQYPALRELLRQLKSLYRIPDRNVLTHSMVAYGRPNRFHRQNHRGRKRCGMIFARPDVRARLGLRAKPGRDLDVEAGRLAVGDPELQRFLYARNAAGAVAAGVRLPAEGNVIRQGRTAWDVAREDYDSATTLYLFPDGSRRRGDEVVDWSRVPAGTRVLIAQSADRKGFEGFRQIGVDAGTPWQLAGDAYDDKTTIYFLPSGIVRTGEELKRKASNRIFSSLPAGTRVLVGYVYGGHVRSRRLPARIAGVKWNYPSTFYRFPDGRILSGDEIDPSAIPSKTLIFFQN